jgi:prephenate dehydratase
MSGSFVPVLLPEPQPAPMPVATDVRVAFQGEHGSFSEQAVVQLWRGMARPVPKRTFDDVMDAAETGEVEYGIVPIESTLVGGVDVAYDLLAMHEGLSVVAETIVPIHLSLMGLPGASIARLKSVLSHPIMLAQCAYFLDAHRHINAEPAWDTAGAARTVVERGDLSIGAAAAPLAAERLGLQVLVAHIEDRPDTMMRFLAVATEPESPPSGVPARTAVLFAVPDNAGALLSVVAPLAAAGFNVSHLTSRPTREPWRYQFFMEFDHVGRDGRAADAVGEIRRVSTYARLLGTFPRWPAPVRDSSTLA